MSRGRSRGRSRGTALIASVSDGMYSKRFYASKNTLCGCIQNFCFFTPEVLRDLMKDNILW